MHSLSLLLTFGITAICGAHAQSTTPKRGLVYIPSSIWPRDDDIFLGSKNAMTWYYSYGSTAPPAVVGTSAALEFVPMLWGDYTNSFISDVRNAVPKVKYIIGFNEPDMITDWGGSNITPQRAAEAWKASIQPLAASGIKLGAPAVSGATAGRDWLVAFMKACTGCTIDFIPLHWYGDFSGLASQLGWASVTFPGKKLWVTELGFDHQDQYVFPLPAWPVRNMITNWWIGKPVRPSIIRRFRTWTG